jgi:hypothetical protein
VLFDPLIDTESDVLAIRKAAIDAVKNGQTVVSWTNEGSSANLAFTLPVQQVLEEANAFLKALNPSKYGYRVKKASGYGRCY